MSLLLIAAAAAATPSPQALRLGRQLAERGTLAALLPLMKSKDVEELVSDANGLNEAEKEALRKVADRVFESGRERLLSVTASEYAKRLSVADLRALVRFYGTPAASRFQAATPQVIAATVARVGQMDFKSDVRRAYCKETGKLCGN